MGESESGGGKRHWRDWFGPVFLPFIRRFASQAAAFDQCVEQHGFQHTAHEWLYKFSPGLVTVGKEQLPTDGPVLIAANHPGAYDGLAIASVVRRNDLKIVAAANPFFRALSNTRQYFIYSTLDTHVRSVRIFCRTPDQNYVAPPAQLLRQEAGRRDGGIVQPLGTHQPGVAQRYFVGTDNWQSCLQDGEHLRLRKAGCDQRPQFLGPEILEEAQRLVPHAGREQRHRHERYA